MSAADDIRAALDKYQARMDMEDICECPDDDHHECPRFVELYSARAALAKMEKGLQSIANEETRYRYRRDPAARANEVISEMRSVAASLINTDRHDRGTAIGIAILRGE